MIETWANKWGISPEALHDLRVNYLGERDVAAHSVPVSMSEEAVAQRVELAFCEMGGILWRNNVGCLPDLRGVPVRFGLANMSKKMNKVTKSADQIGCLPVVIRPDHVGKTFGLFVSIEDKKAAWKWCGNDHELAQSNWAKIITSLGGVGIFCNDPEQIEFLRRI
jgi:hypothetical protein